MPRHPPYALGILGTQHTRTAFAVCNPYTCTVTIPTNIFSSVVRSVFPTKKPNWEDDHFHLLDDHTFCYLSREPHTDTLGAISDRMKMSICKTVQQFSLKQKPPSGGHTPKVAVVRLGVFDKDFHTGMLPSISIETIASIARLWMSDEI